MRFIVTLIFICSQLFLWAQNGTVKYAKVEGLNLREAPSIDASSVVKIAKGDEIDVVEELGQWTHVNYNGVTGYVASKYLTSKKPSTTGNVETVLICNSPNAEKYQAYSCHGLNRCKASISKVSKSEAESNGYEACKICY